MSEAERAPAADGVNVTDTEQFAAAATAVWQEVFTPKSGAFMPANPRARICSGAAPVFAKVNDWAAEAVPTVWFPKFKLVEVSETAGTAPVAPVPLRTICSAAEPFADVVATERFPERTPVPAGMNSSEIVQLAPAAKTVAAEQSNPKDCCAKLAGTDRELTVALWLPELRTVNCCGVLACPTKVVGKVS